MPRRSAAGADDPESPGPARRAPSPATTPINDTPTTTRKRRRRSTADGGGDGGAALPSSADAAPKRARGADGAAVKPHRTPTLAIVVPGSAVDNAGTAERGSALAGALARAAAVFCVDEVVVLDDGRRRGRGSGPPGGGPGPGPGAALLARVLQYLETPQYLRKALIPMHPDLRLAGALPPLDAPHHARAAEWTTWRDGVVVAAAKGAGSVVDVGLELPAVLPQALRPGARVTVHLGPARTPAPTPPPPLAAAAPRGGLAGALAPPHAPRDAAKTYWGYSVRLAPTLEDALAGGPHELGYDLTIGTSERGADAAAALPPAATCLFRHALIAFGGPAGLEAADPAAPTRFTHWVNTCPGQGSRTIRTEEAVLVSLAALRPALHRGVGGGYGGQ